MLSMSSDECVCLGPELLAFFHLRGDETRKGKSSNEVLNKDGLTRADRDQVPNSKVGHDLLVIRLIQC